MDEREALRRRAAERPGFYSPWLHLLLPSAVGLAVILACARGLHALGLADLSFAAGVFVLSNIVEWHAHRDLLHKRFAPLGVLYDRHTPVHHLIFVAGDMEMRTAREFRLVLLPAFGILAILLVTAPPAALLYRIGYRNFGLLYLLVTTAYVVMYEWLHLAYHLPARSLAGPLRFLRALRRHHEAHHDPAQMRRGNFNVTVPLWDFVRGTVLPRGR